MQSPVEILMIVTVTMWLYLCVWTLWMKPCVSVPANVYRLGNLQVFCSPGTAIWTPFMCRALGYRLCRVAVKCHTCCRESIVGLEKSMGNYIRMWSVLRYKVQRAWGPHRRFTESRDPGGELPAEGICGCSGGCLCCEKWRYNSCRKYDDQEFKYKFNFSGLDRRS